MTDAALFCLITVLLVLASRARATLWFVCVLAVLFWIDTQLAGAGGFRYIPWADAFAIFPLAWLTFRNLKWWSVAALFLSAAVLPVHVWYWYEWAKGVWHPDLYKLAANSLFVLSIAALAVGDTNVRQLIGTVLGVLDRVLFGVAPIVRPSRRCGEPDHQEAAQVNGLFTPALRDAQRRYDRLAAGLRGRIAVWRVRSLARQEEAP